MKNMSNLVFTQSEAQRLESLQQQIRGELDLLPVRESDSQNKSFDPFATNMTEEVEKNKKRKKSGKNAKKD